MWCENFKTHADFCLYAQWGPKVQQPAKIPKLCLCFESELRSNFGILGGRKGGCHQHTVIKNCCYSLKRICFCKSKNKVYLVWLPLVYHPGNVFNFYAYLNLDCLPMCLQRKTHLVIKKSYGLEIYFICWIDCQSTFCPGGLEILAQSAFYCDRLCKYYLSVPIGKWISLSPFVSLSGGNPDDHSTPPHPNPPTPHNNTHRHSLLLPQ